MVFRPPGITDDEWHEVRHVARGDSGQIQIRMKASLVHSSDRSHYRDVKLGTAPDGSDAGQVNWIGVARTASVTVADPSRKLDKLVGKGAIAYGLRISYGIWCPDAGKWVDTPVFGGRLNPTTSRSGPVVTLNASAAATWLRHGFGTAVSWKKGTKQTDIARGIVTNHGGWKSSWVSIPDHAQTIKSELHWVAVKDMWNAASSACSDANLTLYTDPEMVCRARELPKSVAFTMETGYAGRPGWLTSEPVATAGSGTIVNRVIVHYAKGKKVEVVDLPASNPFAADNPKMMVNGKPQYYPVEVDHDTVEKKTEAHLIGETVLSRDTIEKVTVQTQCLPFPWLETPFDVGKFGSRDWHVASRVQSASMGLGPGQAMTLGFHAIVNR